MTDRPDDRLQRAIDDWKTGTPRPSEALRLRVNRAVAAAAAEREAQRPAGGAWFTRRWRPALAAAAVLVVALLVVARAPWHDGSVETAAGRLVVADALAAAEAAEREHARAIALLYEAAAPVLARAGHPETPPRESLRLIALRERLASLDAAIEEIQTYLETNPGLASARTMLLAAYTDKTDLLREIVALAEENRA